MDGLETKWVVKHGESGRPKIRKQDGPCLKWTVQYDKKWMVQYEKKWTVHKQIKLDDPQKCVGDLFTQRPFNIIDRQLKEGPSNI